MPRKDKQKKYAEIYEGKDINSLSKLNETASDVIIINEKTSCYFNLMSGQQGLSVDEVKRKNKNHIIIKQGHPAQGYFCYYNAKYDVIVFKLVKIDTKSIPQKGETRQWEDLKFKDNVETTIVFDRDGIGWYESNPLPKKFFSKTKTIDAYGNYNSKQSQSHKNTIKILRDFFGYMFYFSKHDYFTFDNLFNLDYLINGSGYKELSHQNKYQDIIDIDLPALEYNIVNMMNDFVVRSNSFSYGEEKDAVTYYDFFWGNGDTGIRQAVIEKIKDGISVIRVFYTYQDSLQVDTEKFDIPDGSILYTYEYLRIYITNDNFFVCKKVFNKWMLCKNDLTHDWFEFFICHATEEALNNSKLKYFKNEVNICIDDYNKIPARRRDEFWWRGLTANTRNLLWVLMCPLYEQFMKSNLNNFQNLVKRSHAFQRPYNQLTLLFGDINKKETSLQKAIGLPMWMLKLADEFYLKIRIYESSSYQMNIIAWLKESFKSDPKFLSSMNQNQFELLLRNMNDCFFALRRSNQHTFWVLEDFYMIFDKLIKQHGAKKLNDYFEFYVSFYKEYLNTISSVAYPYVTNDFRKYYSDYLQLCEKLKELNIDIDMPYKFNNLRELVSYHNNLVDIYNRRDMQAYDGKFKQLIPLFEKYCYSDDNFTVLYPESANDLAKEGIRLHHCVKSYIEDVINKKTIILFIRKNENINKPFFTLEVKNNTVRQCHGFDNCNTDTVDGLDDFLKKFCEEKKIVYNDGKKVLAVQQDRVIGYIG